MTITTPCQYDDIEGHKPHEFPDDWVFDGANGLDPRADERWRPSTYVYFDADLTKLHTTQVPLCDDQAIDEFTKVANMGPGFNPKYLYVSRGSKEKAFRLPWIYDKATDEVNAG